ncbi:MAG TPA: oxygenase MpaB family protein [Candidatus Acidoferrales bacterium]|nr:oxygenase MpaB family protein [Candidatus Acidoferrales bacterium]
MSDVGLLSRDAVARRVNREAFLLLGGTAALLLQVAHPLVAAGVAEHSDFRRDPIGRLLRTLNTTLAMVFGTTAQASAALGRVDRRHGAVRGTAAGGRRYDARDPRLVVWVQTTLVLTSLRLYELVMGRLSDADREAYWREASFFAMQLGATEETMPRAYADLLRYERDMLATEVIPDANAIAVARDVLRPMPWLPGVVLWASHAFTTGLLPPSLRLAFGLPWRTRERLFYRGVIVSLRFIVPLLPERIRVVPQARRYEARVSGM